MSDIQIGKWGVIPAIVFILAVGYSCTDSKCPPDQFLGQVNPLDSAVNGFITPAATQLMYVRDSIDTIRLDDKFGVLSLVAPLKTDTICRQSDFDRQFKYFEGNYKRRTYRGDSVTPVQIVYTLGTEVGYKWLGGLSAGEKLYDFVSVLYVNQGNGILNEKFYKRETPIPAGFTNELTSITRELIDTTLDYKMYPRILMVSNGRGGIFYEPDRMLVRGFWKTGERPFFLK
jgi:hypothetical protein